MKFFVRMEEPFSLTVRSCNDRDIAEFDFHQPVRVAPPAASVNSVEALDASVPLDSPSIPRKKSATLLKSKLVVALLSGHTFFFPFFFLFPFF